MTIDEVVAQTFTDALAKADKKLKEADRLEFLGKLAIAAFTGVIVGFPPKMAYEVISTVVATALENAEDIRRKRERRH